MRSTIRCGVCSTCLTVLVSPDSAGGGLSRARVVVSWRGVLFSLKKKKSSDVKCLCVRIDRYMQSEYKFVRNWVVKQVTSFPNDFQVDVLHLGKPFFV